MPSGMVLSNSSRCWILQDVYVKQALRRVSCTIRSLHGGKEYTCHSPGWQHGLLKGGSCGKGMERQNSVNNLPSVEPLRHRVDGYSLV